jgi:Tfp pilus assembly protein PilE
MYSSYVSAARETEGWNNLRTLQIAEEEFFLENNAYFSGTSAGDLAAASGGLWQRAESAADANFDYSVTLTGPTAYSATATGEKKSSGVVLTVTKN